jgi:hypothetical protein
MNNDRRWQMSAILTGLIAASLLATGLARADANDGEFLGYRLGDKFIAPEGTKSRPHVAGPRIYEFPVNSRDHGVQTMSLLVSPESSIIGSIFGEWYFSGKRAAEQFADRYLATLARKYEQWTPKDRSLINGDYQLSVEIQKRPRAGGLWPSAKKYRVAISLIYTPDTLGRGEWMAIVYMEARLLGWTRSTPSRRGYGRAGNRYKSVIPGDRALYLIRPGRSRSASSW